jgi:hypothetical protein
LLFFEKLSTFEPSAFNNSLNFEDFFKNIPLLQKPYFSVKWRKFINALSEGISENISYIKNDYENQIQNLKNEANFQRENYLFIINSQNIKLEGNIKYIKELEEKINTDFKNDFTYREILDQKNLNHELTQLKLDYNHLLKKFNQSREEISKLKNILLLLAKKGFSFDDLFHEEILRPYSHNQQNQHNFTQRMDFDNNSKISDSRVRKIETNTTSRLLEKIKNEYDKEQPMLFEIKGIINFKFSK